MKLNLSFDGNVTTVSLIRSINAIGARYTCPRRRMRDALRRIGAPYDLVGVATNAMDVFACHDCYFVSFETVDRRRAA